jgi:hypothetical protein
MAVVIYNCKRCKKGKRVDYPLGTRGAGFYRLGSNGEYIPSCIWIQSCGGGKPTVYGGDTEFGLCPVCGRMMSYGHLKATLRPEVKCSAICTGARGPNCDCSCGGANHGYAA